MDSHVLCKHNGEEASPVNLTIVGSRMLKLS